MREKLTAITFARFFAVLIPFSILFGPAVSDVILSLTLVSFFTHCYTHKHWDWMCERWLQVALILVAFMTIRSAFLPNGQDTLTHALVWMRLPLFAAAMAYAILPHKPTERWLIRVTTFTVAFLVCDTLWQFYNGTDILGHPFIMNEDYPRLTGPFRAPRVGITMLWLIVPVLAYLLEGVEPKFRFQKLAGVALLVGGGIAIYTSGERMALVLMIMGTALTFLLMPRARMLVIVASVIAVLVGWHIAQNDETLVKRQVGSTTQTVTSYGDSVYGRTWLSAGKVFMDHKLVGVGLKQFQAACQNPKYGPDSPNFKLLRCPLHPHNIYLAWLVEGGAIGLGLYLCLLACWIGLLVKHWRNWWKHPIATGLVIAICLRLFPISITPNHTATWVVIPMWFYVGWLLALLQSGKNPQSNA